MNCISEKLRSLNEVMVSQGGRLKWKNANIRESRHLDFRFIIRTQLYLLIRSSNQLGLWVTNCATPCASAVTSCAD